MPNLFDILNYKGEFAKEATENLNEDLLYDLKHNFEVEVACTNEYEPVSFDDGSVYSNTIWSAGWDEEKDSWYLTSTYWSDDGAEVDGDFYTFDSYEKLLGTIRDMFKKEDLLDPYKELILEKIVKESPDVPALSDDSAINAQAMIKLVEIAQALAARFGFDPALVLEDMFKDLRLIGGESVLNVLDPNNPVDQITAQMYDDYKVAEALANFFGLNARNIMLQRLLDCDPEECCDQLQQFVDAGHQIPFANPRLIPQNESLLEDVDDEFFDQTSGFWTWMLSECFLNEAYKDYDPKDGWTEDDIELHKSIDWKARNWEEYDTGDSIRGTIYVYGDEGTKQYPNKVFHKFLRSNPIYSPYYRPLEAPGMSVVGPMFDGRKHNGYDIHDRYESLAIYNLLSEDIKKLNENLPKDLVQAYKNSEASGDVDYNLEHRRISDRKRAGYDYGKAHYEEISKEEAIRMLKNRENVESLRLIVPSRYNGNQLIQFVDKGGYGDGKYYRPLYQLYYIRQIRRDLAFTNKNGNLVDDSRKIPVQYLAEIATKIYKTEDELPLSADALAKREASRVKQANTYYQVRSDGKHGHSTRLYSQTLDTGNHSGFVGYDLSDLADLWRKVKRLKATLKDYEAAIAAADPESDKYERLKRDYEAEKAHYEEVLGSYKDLRAALRYSVQAALENIKAKINILREIKDQLRDIKSKIFNLKQKGLDNYSDYEYSLEKIKNLLKRKQELEDKLKTATTGKQEILDQIEDIKKQLEAKTSEIAGAESEIGSIDSIKEKVEVLNKTISTFNDVVKQLASITDSLKTIDDDLAEKEEEIDTSLADRDAASIIRKLDAFENQIKELEEKRRQLFHKTNTNVAKDIDPNDPEFDLFRKPIVIAPEVAPETAAEIEGAQEEGAENNEDVEEALNLDETVDMIETYTDQELKDLEGRIFNQQKILNIYRTTKYDIPQLFAHTKCTECGKEKRVLLSNLLNDPEKYGSCKCSKENEKGRARKIVKIYRGKKRLPTNTSGYTGVYHLKTYNGKPYDKWRAIIEIDGEKKFLGDFDTKKEAAEARKKAAREGIKWYKKNSPVFQEDLEAK